MSGILAGELPAGWVRCPELGCGARAGHEPPHVPEAVPPVPLSATEPAPVSARAIAVSATRCPCALGPDLAHVAERVPPRPVCTCTGHGPDLACVEHGEAQRARMAEWTR